MKTKTLILLFIPLLFNGCKQFGQGTPGGQYEMGMDRAEGSTPYALGRTSQYQRSGMPDVNVAASRVEAGLATSPSGRAELSRRSAAATVRSPWQESTFFGPEVPTLDQIILGRVQLALSSTTPEHASGVARVSIETWHNLQVSSTDGYVVLRGTVTDFQEKEAIESLVRQVEGVRGVRSELEVQTPR
jgi:hypothetical protein